ncbi:extracellular solute-binding protein [Solibacillus isronensis]|uniref:extracellular solute-binding protein n=1 Tax=Solibacillus isronensis TaxID=412383 RepID=UPI0039A052C3
MSSLRKTFLFYVFPICLLLLLAGCSSEEAKKVDGTPKDVTLTFWFDDAGPLRNAIWEEMIAAFEEEYPHIHIEYKGFVKDIAKTKFNSALAMQSLPDVGSIYTSWLPEYTYREALVPLDSYFENWAEGDKIAESVINYNRHLTQDQKLYGLPYTRNMDVLWVRKDWLADYGLETIETWDDFFHTVETFTDKELQQYGYSIRGGEGSSLQLQRMMYAYSGISTYIENGESTIDDPRHVEFLKKYLSLYDLHTSRNDIVKDYKGMLDDFEHGAVGLIQHNIGSYAEHQKVLSSDQFESLPLPKSVDGHYTVEAGNTMDMVMFEGTKHPKEAWTFISFIASQKGQSHWNKRVGQLPTHQEVLQEDWVQNSPHLQTALSVYEDPQTKMYEPPFYLIGYNAIRYTIVEPGLQEVLSGTKTIEQFLGEWSEAIENEYAQYENIMPKQEAQSK